MPRVVPIFQQHHAIEQQTLGNSRLLKALADAGRFNIDADQNLINMPHDKALAQALGVSPHNGGPIREYRIGLEANLARLERSRDGQAALAGDLEAMDRIAAKVHRLSDISQVGLVNGDLRTNTALGQSTDQARARRGSSTGGPRSTPSSTLDSWSTTSSLPFFPGNGAPSHPTRAALYTRSSTFKDPDSR